MASIKRKIDWIPGGGGHEDGPTEFRRRRRGLEAQKGLFTIADAVDKMVHTRAGLMLHDIAAIRRGRFLWPEVLWRTRVRIEWAHPFAIGSRLRPHADFVRTLEVAVEDEAAFGPVEVVISVVAIGLVDISEAETCGTIAELDLDVVDGVRFEGASLHLTGSGKDPDRVRVLSGHDV